MANIGIITTIHFIMYIMYIWWQTVLINPLLIAVAINVLMLFRIFYAFGLKYACYRISRGQILPIMFYIIWLTIFPRHQHIYVLPILLSNIGKSYLLFTTPQNLDIDSVQNLIVLQAKFEISVLVYSIFRLFILTITSKNMPYALMVYSILFLILKIKYQIHYGTRKAYEEIHFGLDRIAKAFNLRGIYHLAHQMVSQLGTPWKSQKQITY